MVVITDHSNLELFVTTKLLNRRQARWTRELAGYDFKIFFRHGKKNSKAENRSLYKVVVTPAEKDSKAENRSLYKIAVTPAEKDSKAENRSLYKIVVTPAEKAYLIKQKAAAKYLL